MRNALDPSDPSTKKMIKGSIADAIVKGVTGADRDHVVRQVEAEYERILSHADVFTHIPSLTTGAVLRAERRLHPRQASDPARAPTSAIS